MNIEQEEMAEAMMEKSLEELKEQASYHYKELKIVMDKIYEIDENEGQALWEYFEEIGGI